MFQATQRYQEIETKLSKDVLKIKASLNAMIYYRLFVFFLIPAVLYFFWNINTSLKVLLVAIPVVLFFYLIKKNKQINDQYQLLKTKRDINIDEQEPWNSSSSKFKNGAEFQDPQHPYTYDLDVFGKGSLFQYLNRAESIGGQEKLANWLAKAEKDQDELTARQEAISEMSNKIEFRQATQARIRLCEEKKGDLDKLMKWSKEPKKIKINFFHKLLLWLVPVYSFGLLFMLSWDWISVTLFLVLIVLPLTLSAVLLKPLNEEYKTLEKAFKSVSKYGEVFHFLGSTEWNSSKLIRIKEQTNGASESLTSLEKVVSAFDQRINGLVMLFMNIFITWDLRCVLRLYKWKDTYIMNLETWFDELAVFESLSSLSNFKANHFTTTTNPSFNKQGRFNYQDLGHPFLTVEERVNNDFELDKNTFTIITGANMAGKSTFLRTVGVNMILALAGGPVLAKKFEVFPIDLFTSMRTTDSLQDNKSYFYSELLRLSLIVEKLQSGSELFIILDEILKGTNSKDKAEGSFKFMEKIIKLKSTGIVATHDLSLCKIEDQYPDQFYNYFFDVKIKEDDLDFDYKLRKGVCENMNATFLMEKMGIA